MLHACVTPLSVRYLSTGRLEDKRIDSIELTLYCTPLSATSEVNGYSWRAWTTSLRQVWAYKDKTELNRSIKVICEWSGGQRRCNPEDVTAETRRVPQDAMLGALTAEPSGDHGFYRTAPPSVEGGGGGAHPEDPSPSPPPSIHTLQWATLLRPSYWVPRVDVELIAHNNHKGRCFFACSPKWRVTSEADNHNSHIWRE